MKKNFYIEELKEGDRVDDLFLLKSVKVGETRAGKPYLLLTVMDKTGDLSGPVWENVPHMQTVCVVGDVVKLTGAVQSYRDNLQLKIEKISPVVQEQVDKGAFFPASPHNRDQMAEELHALVRSVKNPYLKKLLNHFFNKSEWWNRFQDAPAAKGIHHAYIGGLLEHCLSVGEIADFLAGHYEGVDRCLLIAGALLHDIGKLEELAFDGGLVEYTVCGRLKGHLVIGSEMVGQTAGKIRDFPSELLEQLQHIILSHHGRQEFGSPTVPMTVEAFMLSFLDDLDAKMNVTEQLRRKMDSEEKNWTGYQRSLERFLYLGGFQKKETEGEEAQPESNQRQPSLF